MILWVRLVFRSEDGYYENALTILWHSIVLCIQYLVEGVVAIGVKLGYPLIEEGEKLARNEPLDIFHHEIFGTLGNDGIACVPEERGTCSAALGYTLAETCSRDGLTWGAVGEEVKVGDFAPIYS